MTVRERSCEELARAYFNAYERDWVRAGKGGDAAGSNFSVSAPFAEWMVPGKLDWDKQEFAVHQQCGSEQVRWCSGRGGS